MAATHRFNPARISNVRDGIVHLLDALARGASPPGMIDMTPFRSPAGHVEPWANTNSHLRRRFTMIATFDRQHRNVRRWSAAGVALSLALGALALTGPVRGQEGAAKPDAPAEPAAARGGGRSANLPAPPPTSAAAPAPAKRPLTREQAQKLWDDRYAPQIITVNGQEANREQVDRQYLEELSAAGGVEEPESGPKGRASTAAPADGAETDEDRAMAALLARRVPELNFDGVALADVIDFLRDVSGANVFVEWGSLEGAGIDRATPVTLRAKNIAFSNALDLVLASAGKGSVPIGYAFKDGVIQITMGEQLDRLVETRAYDVRDLVPSEIDMTELGLMVRSSVAPDSWRENGGTVGALHTSKHKMIVTATGPSHRKIRGILEMLRDEPRQAKTDEAATAAQGPAGPRQ